MVSITQVQAAIEREGRPILIRRIATSVAPVLLNARGVVRNFQASELVNGVIQGDRRVVISNKEIEAQSWPGPPKKGDQVVIDGKTFTVQGCDTHELRGSVAKHVLQVRG